MKRAALAIIALAAPVLGLAHDQHGLIHDHASPLFFISCWILASIAAWLFDSLTTTEEK